MEEDANEEEFEEEERPKQKKKKNQNEGTPAKKKRVRVDPDPAEESQQLSNCLQGIYFKEHQSNRTIFIDAGGIREASAEGNCFVKFLGPKTRCQRPCCAKKGQLKRKGSER